MPGCTARFSTRRLLDNHMKEQHPTSKQYRLSRVACCYQLDATKLKHSAIFSTRCSISHITALQDHFLCGLPPPKMVQCHCSTSGSFRFILRMLSPPYCSASWLCHHQPCESAVDLHQQAHVDFWCISLSADDRRWRGLMWQSPFFCFIYPMRW